MTQKTLFVDISEPTPVWFEESWCWFNGGYAYHNGLEWIFLE
jgi:hypothetical protein